eukprot:TRINITY_DN8261_c0_g2_i9.p4 TRINITY_DN8261_c0_g2~~TRINITY_DN8261_c0_g2_i9.p4  ORF type:complete len:112 (+),score=13.52 TRINITY_DN8261_c0_g2_i9:637-972(+)
MRHLDENKSQTKKTSFQPNFKQNCYSKTHRKNQQKNLSSDIQKQSFIQVFAENFTNISTIGPPPHPKGATPEQTTPLKERKTPRVLYDNKVYIQNTKKNKNVKYTPSQTEL